MNVKRKAIAAVTKGLMAGAASAAVLTGCSSGEVSRVSATSIWVPASAPQIASVDNSAYYAFAATPDYDALVYEENFAAGGSPHHRLVWILGVPTRSVYNQRLAVDGEQMFGWLLEEVPGEQTHAVPLTGTVTLQHRDADSVSTTVDLRAAGPQPVAGDVARAYRVLAQKVVWERRDPLIPTHHELETTSGVPHR